MYWLVQEVVHPDLVTPLFGFVVAVSCASNDNRHLNYPFLGKIQNNIRCLETVHLRHVDVHENHWVSVESTIADFLVLSLPLLNQIDALVPIEGEV